MGIGGVALAWLLQREGLLAKPVKPDLAAAAHSLLPKTAASPAARQSNDFLFHAGRPEPHGYLRPQADAQ